MTEIQANARRQAFGLWGDAAVDHCTTAESYGAALCRACEFQAGQNAALTNIGHKKINKSIACEHAAVRFAFTPLNKRRCPNAQRYPSFARRAMRVKRSYPIALALAGGVYTAQTTSLH